VKGAFEYDSGKIIALLNGKRSICFVNRILEQEDKDLRIDNITRDTDYKALLPFPGYNYQTFPYVLVKDSKSLSVINLRTMGLRVILKESQYGHDVLRTCLIDFSPVIGEGNKFTLYNLELISRLIN
jgi:hypothetical protein